MNSNPMSEMPLPSDSPWHQAWPADELERVPACPICGGVERTVLHEHLVDNVFLQRRVHGPCMAVGSVAGLISTHAPVQPPSTGPMLITIPISSTRPGKTTTLS